MSSFTISDLQRFVRRRDLLPSVNGGAVRLQFFRYGIQDLASPDQFWILVATRRVIFAIFVPAATSSTMVIHILGFPAMLTRLFGFSSQYLYDCFNGYVHARSLGIAAQILKKRTGIYRFMV
jgi:hypothetical protein